MKFKAECNYVGVNQLTSRDGKELRILRVITEDGELKFFVPQSLNLPQFAYLEPLICDVSLSQNNNQISARLNGVAKAK